MTNLPRPALIAGLLWILACVVWLIVVARRGSAKSDAGRSHGYPGRYPGLLLNGIALLALTPVISAVQYIASHDQAFWGGAWIFLGGLVLIGYHFLLARRPSDWWTRATVTSFREKSLVAQIFAILVVYGIYGVRVWRQPLTPVEAIAALIGITVMMIIIGIASHIAIALYVRPEKSDERDRAVELRGSRNAYYALAAGIWCILFLIIAGTPHGLLFYAAMAVFAVAELVRLGSQLFYYRLGA